MCLRYSLRGCMSFTLMPVDMAAFRLVPEPCCCLCCRSAVSDACVEAGSLNAYSVHLSSGLCPARGSQTITFRGVPCGPGNSLVQWEALSAPACGAELSRATLDPKQQADWVGQCGVPPMQISGLPTKICSPATTTQAGRRHRARHTVAPPHQDLSATEYSSGPEVMAVVEQALARKNLATGESTTNWGMSRIGALAGQSGSCCWPLSASGLSFSWGHLSTLQHSPAQSLSAHPNLARHLYDACRFLSRPVLSLLSRLLTTAHTQHTTTHRRQGD